MSVHNIELELAALLGYDSLDSFRAGTRLMLIENNDYLCVKFTDHFLAAYANWSHVYVAPYEKKTDLEKAKMVLSRVRAKIKQTRTLEEIRLKGFETVRQAIHEAFGYDLDIISNEDITFPRSHTVAVGPLETSYSGTIVEKSFSISMTAYVSFHEMNRVVLAMREYLDKKQAEYDSKR